MFCLTCNLELVEDIKVKTSIEEFVCCCCFVVVVCVFLGAGYLFFSPVLRLFQKRERNFLSFLRSAHNFIHVTMIKTPHETLFLN